MALTPLQQAQDIIKKSSSIIIVLPRNPSVDAVASGLGLFLVLEKLKKDAKVVCNEFRLPPNVNFLAKSDDIHTELSSLRQFIISLDVSRTSVEELSYDIQNKKLNIYITPRNGYFEEKDVTLAYGNFAYNLIIILGAPDLESLGKMYDDQTEFFYRTPILNIDHEAANENFGQVNLVDVTATSISEIVFELAKSLGGELLDEYIATNLLTGIISKTKSFQSPAVTPKSLAIASHLIDSGARREEIIKNLYQTKSIETLKLWGRTLARLRSTKNNTIVWSLLTAEDFTKSGARPEDLPGVIDELIVNTPEAKAIFILYEKKPQQIHGIVSTPTNVDALAVFKAFQAEGSHDFTKIRLPEKDLLVAEQTILKILQPHIA